MYIYVIFAVHLFSYRFFLSCKFCLYCILFFLHTVPTVLGETFISVGVLLLIFRTILQNHSITWEITMFQFSFYIMQIISWIISMYKKYVHTAVHINVMKICSNLAKSIHTMEWKANCSIDKPNQVANCSGAVTHISLSMTVSLPTLVKIHCTVMHCCCCMGRESL